MTNIAMMSLEKMDLDCMYFNISLEFFRIHIRFSPHVE